VEALPDSGLRRDTGHFSLLQTQPVILCAADWETNDPTAALWTVLEALPSERSYLLLTPSWSMGEDGTGQRLTNIQAVRDRFEHVEVVILAPSAAELVAWKDFGETTLYCSHNALVREDLFFPIPGRQQTVDAIYDARWADYKRHELAAGVKSLALIAYPQPLSCSASYTQRALRAVGHATWFTKPWVPTYLSSPEVNAAYNKARVGLCLSEVEGANFASIQYLLAGLPVVTTRNRGGRDEFLSERVARWVEDDADAVAAAVDELAALRLEPDLIRNEALAKTAEHRDRLVEWIRARVDEESRRPSRWHLGWPPGLRNKLWEPPASVGEVTDAIGDGGHRESSAPFARRVTLTDQEKTQFEDQGFLMVDRALVTADELAEVRRLLDGLFERFEDLPKRFAYDLGDVKEHHGTQQVPEINFCLDFEPLLAETAAFASCRDLAQQLLSSRAFCDYDHAIYKPPAVDTAVGWHQDMAYAPDQESPDEVHIWLALHDATEANGCMQFVPASHRLGLLPHRPRAHDPRAHALVTDFVDSSSAVACPVGAGMAVVHRPATLHTTAPNTTDEIRASWILQFVDRGP